ncbi:diaminopimelate decarboxylase [Oceanobacillus sp. J11TS1]|uniref:diaminopimelate decarboxylase n=1 Tax=Oceanobacillus sp. J11TS1 TaxID=2807191 RepID=UPI001B0145CC|nr:diaminopimelate decarboxylase [Oceanobacillus sp. J11TS1]GIO22578.1 diaminopimelate decarboxylase [Oceanobacillus sp. J11TS1]
MILDAHPFKVNTKGHLEIGGVDTVELAEKYGTPLYVYDVEMIRNHARAFVQAFREAGIRGKVAYASKAFSSVAMLQVAKQEGLCLDVISEGELYTALLADFPTERIHMHGNNKSEKEIAMAVEHEIGCIVIDNFHDIDLLDVELIKQSKTMNVLLRVTPGVESKTHKYIMTGNEDSKFGFDLQNGQAEEALKMLLNHPRIHVKGLHCHIGSQIFGTEGFRVAADILFAKLEEWKRKYQFISEALNLGGGFGIRYTKEDQPLPLAEYVKDMVQSVEQNCEKYQMKLPEVWIEPGRSIVGDAGITLYSIGANKNIPGVREYYSIDGGMTDNIRPALYQAKYDAVIANRPTAPIEKEVSIAGKCCESGDMLIWDLPVPQIRDKDILAVLATGAYNYSMASHYNRLTKPAVVFIEDGQDHLVVRRETYQDIVKNDLSYERINSFT